MCWEFFFFPPHIQYDINLISSGKQLTAIKESAIYQGAVNPSQCGFHTILGLQRLEKSSKIIESNL